MAWEDGIGLVLMLGGVWCADCGSLRDLVISPPELSVPLRSPHLDHENYPESLRMVRGGAVDGCRSACGGAGDFRVCGGQ